MLALPARKGPTAVGFSISHLHDTSDVDKTTD